ncbi:hypothetical protein [Arthrobacter sp. Rue61a]|uniref:hypothetical protein n=1 Tax=Arthrobacter sp. Rue61a TaxID=1118963 RepID=UPI001392227F|nr:hypothetical protein [Arthrobacter sp. Rue61a]
MSPSEAGSYLSMLIDQTSEIVVVSHSIKPDPRRLSVSESRYLRASASHEYIQ